MIPRAKVPLRAPYLRRSLGPHKSPSTKSSYTARSAISQVLAIILNARARLLGIDPEGKK